MEDGSGVGVFDEWVVVAQLLDNLAVARRAAVDGHHAEKRPVLAAQLFHADTNCHANLVCQLSVINLRVTTHRVDLLSFSSSALSHASCGARPFPCSSGAYPCRL